MLQLQYHPCPRARSLYRRSKDPIEICMKLAILSAGAPRHAINLTGQLQGISDSEGWGCETQFIPWENDGYDSFDFGSVNWCWWEGAFERLFEWMLRYDECKHLCRWIGTDLLQHLSLVQRGYPDPFRAASIHLADAPHLADEAR